MLSAATNRRGALRAGALAGLAAAGAVVTTDEAAAAVVTTDAAARAATGYVTRAPLLAGADPYVTLYDGETPTGHALMWKVDWSTHGTGAVHPGPR
ncbi:hypothetical protein ACQP2T_44840 [Nonomuraea sp. CA-143628]|uniref:hypothetical protein n=1 Tax=Nonomuraea sp. CA-143628 TaxID=3239997 RepID=UPI003D8A2FAC